MKIPNILKKRWFLFILVIGLIFGIYFLINSKRNTQNNEKVVNVSRQDLKEIVSTQGKITAGSQAVLKFQTGGRLVWVGAKKGDRVSKWQTIASLDQADLKTRFKKALLSYQTTRLTFDQTLEDNKESISTRNYLDIATMNDESLSIMRLLQKNQISLDQSVADVEIASIARQYGSLYSPIDGILIEATDEFPGVNVSATTQYIVVDPNSLRFQAEVEEVDVVKIAAGQSATVTLDALAEETLNSVVSTIEFNSTTTSTGNTAYNVYIPLTLDQRFRLDLSGTAEIMISQKDNVLAVPSELVLEDETGKFVIVKTNNTYQKQYVKTGIETDDYYEVIEGLTEGQSIITPTAEIEEKLNK